MAILKASVGAWNIAAFIHLNFLTGCSPDEIRGLYWDQIDDLDSEAPGFDVARSPSASRCVLRCWQTTQVGLQQRPVVAVVSAGVPLRA
jgi:hypothetical protein